MKNKILILICSAELMIACEARAGTVSQPESKTIVIEPAVLVIEAPTSDILSVNLILTEISPVEFTSINYVSVFPVNAIDCIGDFKLPAEVRTAKLRCTTVNYFAGRKRIILHKDRWLARVKQRLINRAKVPV